MTDVDLNDREQAVVNAFQGGFPVVERPFEPAAEALRRRGVDVSAATLLATIKGLAEDGTLSRFGALVNAEEIGGTATLVAMHAPEDRFDELAGLVNDHREVAHNYEREHPHLNMWFVLSVADSNRIEEVLGEIEAETGQQTYNLPKIREFRVEAKFYLDGPLETEDVDLSDLGPSPSPSGRTELTPPERDLIVEIQEGLPLTETPYADVADAIGRETEWVTDTLRRFVTEDKIRRVGVVPNHYSLGYTENGMTVWDVPDDLVTDVGPAVAGLDFVTHCYERPRHEGVWPYNMFAMTHGRSEAESQRRVQRVREKMAEFYEVSEDGWDTLFSTRVLKKTGIRLAERAAANTDESAEARTGESERAQTSDTETR